MKTSEIVYGGLWAASAVAVAGYTWSAFTGEYEQFPTMGGGGTTAKTPPAVQQGDSAIGLPKLPHNKSFTLSTTGIAASPITPNTATGGLFGSVTKWLSGFFG